MAKCKGCGAHCEWQKTVKGQWMLVEPEEHRHDDCLDGDTLITFGGNVVHVRSDVSMPNVKGRFAHWKNCPNAGDFRKRKN